MSEQNHGHEREICHEERVKRLLHAVYARKTRERQIFMEDLKEDRKQRFKRMFGRIRDSVGPRWYQALSEVQSRSLNSLKSFIHQDILEARPHRTAGVMRDLGLYPLPNNVDLLSCVYAGRDDSKVMLAQLYHITFGYPIETKQASYCLNARLLMSAILYLGLHDIIDLLRRRYTPDTESAGPPPKPKPKPEPPVPSPYLEKLVAPYYEKPKYQRPPPLPLPNLDDLNDPYEEIRIEPKPPPPPPPPPPPKKRLPKSYCDKLAGIQPMGLYTESNIDLITGNRQSMKPSHNENLKASNQSKNLKKKRYGLNLPPINKKRRKKMKFPSTGLENAQYTINGVYIVNGKSYLILGNVTILPPQGDIIHGGSTYVEGNVINIHCGHRGFKPPALSLPCDCVQKWQDTVFEYLNNSKCKCGHHYDYRHEGRFPQDELPYFIKPTRHSKPQFNYHHIFDLDPQHHHIEKEFTKIWEADSMLFVGERKVRDDDKKKKKKKTSKTCLGQHPKPEDYLKCAIRFMRNINITARLPDLHLVPELKEWMRYRLYGPLSPADKLEYLRKSTTYWLMFNTLANKNFGHVSPPTDPRFCGCTTHWGRKHALNKQFKVYVQNYKLAIYRSHAYLNNLMWRTMYQAEFPDKKFREIYFSYLISSLQDLHVMCPYNARDAHDRMITMAKRRYICLPPALEKNA